MRRRITGLAVGLATALAAAGCAETVPDAPAPTGPAATTAAADPVESARRGVVTVRAGEGTSASGFLLTADGHVLTAEAVAGEEPLTVVFHDGETTDASLVGADSRTSLAVVRVEAAPQLAPATFAPEPVAAGVQVLAIAGPDLAAQDGSGEVVATDQVTGAVSGFQIDAPAEPGSAGGPVVDSAGQVVGVIVANLVAADGSGSVGYAVPADLASRVGEQLVAGGPVAHPYLGVAMEEDDAGALVTGVTGGSPADQAGLRSGDVITVLGGRPVDAPGVVVTVVQAAAVGDELTITYTRDGATQEEHVTLEEAPG